jgi:hypothetical protein
MFGRIHYLLWAAAGFLGGATVQADAGYLPQGGPIPLRFRVRLAPVAEPVPPPASISLPPPPMPSKPPDPPIAPPANVAVTNWPALEYNARDPAAVTRPDIRPDIQPDRVVVPQMLLKYFTASPNIRTNAVATGAAAPFGFTPPATTTSAPTPPPTSKAASSTPP